MSTRLCSIVTILLLCGVVTTGYAQRPTESEIAVAGDSGLAQFLAMIPPGSESVYGFHNQEELLRAKLGTPFQLFTILPDDIRDTLRPGKEYFVPTNEWRIPVTVDGATRALLTISRDGDRWRAVDFGAAGLASEIGGFCALHPIDNTRQRLVLLRLYQLRSDLLLVSESNAPISSGRIFPLRSTELMFERQKLSIQSEYTEPQLLPLLKELYSREVNNEE